MCQSLAYTRPNSINSSLARSVVSGLISPKFIRPSSNVHHRECGIPPKVAGAGTIDSVRAEAPREGIAASPSRSRDRSTSSAYQSICPREYSSATSTFSCCPSAAEQLNRYSRRSGTHAPGPDGWAKDRSNQATNRAPRASASAFRAASEAIPSDARPPPFSGGRTAPPVHRAACDGRHSRPCFRVRNDRRGAGLLRIR